MEYIEDKIIKQFLVEKPKYSNERIDVENSDYYGADYVLYIICSETSKRRRLFNPVIGSFFVSVDKETGEITFKERNIKRYNRSSD